MKLLVMTLLIIFNLFLSGSVFTQLQMFGVSPDILICFIASILCIENRVNSVIFAILGGLALDIVFSDMIGFYTLQYFCSSVVMYYFAQRIYRESIVFPAIVSFFGVFVKEVVCAIIILFMGYEFGFIQLIFRYVFPGMIMTGIIAIFVHVFVKQIYRLKFMRRRATTEFLDNL